MKTGLHPHLRRSLSITAVGIVALALTACTGRGGGQLPPNGDPRFTGPASFGFHFSCEDNSALHGPTGQLRIQLSYTDHATNPLGSSFSIHGIADTIAPPELESVIESAFCIGQNPPPGGHELIFLGRYRLLSSAPADFSSTCAAREADTTPLCRFEVIVRDNDMDSAPSMGDYFHITLASATAALSEMRHPNTKLDPATVFYTRGGILSSGNLTVD